MAKLHSDLQNKEFWYKDITLVPNRLPDFERDKVGLSANFTKKIILKTPFVSSPMDTVTEAEMSILMALMGGIGVIHYNFAAIDEQIDEAKKVKRFEAAFVKEPVCLSPNHTVGDIYKVNEKYGFFSAPITEDGTLKTKLVGIVTDSDLRKNDAFPLATKDNNKQLRAFIAVEARLSLVKERMKKEPILDLFKN